MVNLWDRGALGVLIRRGRGQSKQIPHGHLQQAAAGGLRFRGQQRLEGDRKSVSVRSSASITTNYLALFDFYLNQNFSDASGSIRFIWGGLKLSITGESYQNVEKCCQILQMKHKCISPVICANEKTYFARD